MRTRAERNVALITADGASHLAAHSDGCGTR